MALQFKINHCESSDCTQFTFQEATGPWHPTANPGGWGGDVTTTSNTNLTIGLGAQSLTIPVDLEILTGQTVTVFFDFTNYMVGTVTSYNSNTGTLEVNVTSITGAGNYGVWLVQTSGGNPDTSDVTNIVSTITDPNNNQIILTNSAVSENGITFIRNLDFGYSTPLPDGLYTITSVLTIGGTDYTFNQSFFSTCNIQCCVFNTLKKAKEKTEDCDCNEDITFELFVWARWKTLKFMAAGCDITGAQAELTKLKELCGQNVDCGCS